jgi:hypothetical protein
LDFIRGFVKTGDSIIITFFNIYITCIKKRKNVEIIFLISNIYIIERMYEKKSFKKVFACHVENHLKIGAIFFGGAIFLAGTVSNPNFALLSK